MAAKAQAAKAATGWKPAIADGKVKAATGKGRMGWFVIRNLMIAVSNASLGGA